MNEPPEYSRFETSIRPRPAVRSVPDMVPRLPSKRDLGLKRREMKGLESSTRVVQKQGTGWVKGSDCLS